MWYFYIFLFGLIVGSFVNVVIYRLPRGKSFVSGRSACVNCGAKLAWYDLIPVLSFVLLRRRCRDCKKNISWIYPSVELYSGIIFLVLFRLFGPHNLAIWLFSIFLLETFLILALVDFEHLILPDSVMVATLAAALIYGTYQRFAGVNFGNQIFSSENLLAACAFFIFFFLIWFFSKGQWLGLGDAKLVGLLGLIFGLWGGLIIIYGAVASGALVGLVLLASKRANLKTKLPLGTFLSAAASVYVFFGTQIADWFESLFFLVPFIIK